MKQLKSRAPRACQVGHVLGSRHGLASSTLDVVELTLREYTLSQISLVHRIIMLKIFNIVT